MYYGYYFIKIYNNIPFKIYNPLLVKEIKAKIIFLFII